MIYKDFYNKLRNSVDLRIYNFHDVIINKDLDIFMKERIHIRKPSLKPTETLLIESIDLNKIRNPSEAELKHFSILSVMHQQAIATVKGLVSNKAKIPDDYLNRKEKDIPMEKKVFREYEEFLEENQELLTKHLDLLKEVYIGMHIQEINHKQYTQALFRLGFKNAVEMCGNEEDKEPENFTEVNKAGKSNFYI